LGGVGWAAGVTLLGYFLGNTIPGVDKYIYPIIAFIIVLSLLPVAHQWWQRHTSAPRP
jgi:membrane-associated protein